MKLKLTDPVQKSNVYQKITFDGHKPKLFFIKNHSRPTASKLTYTITL